MRSLLRFAVAAWVIVLAMGSADGRVIKASVTEGTLFAVARDAEPRVMPLGSWCFLKTPTT